MSSPFLVPEGWTINVWAPDTGVLPEGIPSDGFQQGGPLEITLETGQGAESFRLDWRNAENEHCFVTNLHSNEAQTELRGQNLTANFGTRLVLCDLTVTLVPTASSEGLSGRITLPEAEQRMPFEVDGPDTGGGTFTATANGGPNGALYTRRPT